VSGEQPDFDLSSLGPGPAHYDLARTMAGEGAAFSQIAQRLRADGLRPDFVWRVVCEVAGEFVRCRVIAGVPDAQIRHALMLRGLSEDESQHVIETAREKHYRGQRLAGFAVGKSAAVGVTLITIGTILWLGNNTGLFPTVSGAGMTLIIAGILVAGINFRKKPRR
jgi:hypothetical protein